MKKEKWETYFYVFDYYYGAVCFFVLSVGISHPPVDGRFCWLAVDAVGLLLQVVAATNLCAPKSSTNPASCHARRPSSKKMKNVELQAVQVSLLEEKANLLKEMENWRRTLEQLRVDNDKLQLLFKFAKQPETVQQAAGQHRPISPPSSSHPRSKDLIQLPDLNEPLPDC